MTSHHSSPLGDPHLVHLQVATQDFDHAAATRIVRDHLAAGRHLEALVHDRYLLPV